jgi:hypothetical protein
VKNIVHCHESYGIKPETKGQSFTCTLLRVFIGFRMTDRHRSKSQSMGCGRGYNRTNMHERKC